MTKLEEWYLEAYRKALNEAWEKLWFERGTIEPLEDNVFFPEKKNDC